MYKKIFALVLIVGLCSLAAAAQETQGKKESTGLSDWLRSIQKKIEQIIPKKSLPVTTGVAGVRGAKEDSQVKLYWKGKKGDESVTEGELAKFKAGVDFAAKGDKQASVKELEDFMKQYPDSPLIPDVKKTLDMVKAEGK
jgi:TolA-binding protein